MIFYLFYASDLFLCLCSIECETGKYGIDCQQRCSAFCHTSWICHHITGACRDGCKSGWKGELCLEGTTILFQTHSFDKHVV